MRQHLQRSTLFPYTTLFRSDAEGGVLKSIKTVEGATIIQDLAFTYDQRRNLQTRTDNGGFGVGRDRKSTRLNSSHVEISYAVFCLKKKITHMSDFYLLP